MRKNLHLEHIEDEIFNFGSDGLRSSIEFINSLREMLAGNNPRSVNLTTKFDGAPAIFCGTDPADGQFFVGTKGVFNKEPKVIKTQEDITRLGYKGGLAVRLELCLEHLSKLEIEGVLQGDLMYVKSDLQTTKIGEKQYTIFQPNTIVYATDPKQGDIDKKINLSELGIVFHTTYSGNTLPEMSASFGADISGLKTIPEVWVSNANYQNMSGTLNMNQRQYKKLHKLMSKVGEMFRMYDTKKLDRFLKFQNELPNSVIGASIKTYINSNIRKGKKVADAKELAKGYRKYFEDFMFAKIVKLKSDRVKNTKFQKLDDDMKNFKEWTPLLEKTFEIYTRLVEAKEMILDKLNTGAKRFSSTFVRTNKGYKVVSDEGYVAIDMSIGKAVKLVDRLEFSYNNFNGIKNWIK